MLIILLTSLINLVRTNINQARWKKNCKKWGGKKEEIEKEKSGKNYFKKGWKINIDSPGLTSTIEFKLSIAKQNS